MLTSTAGAVVRAVPRHSYALLVCGCALVAAAPASALVTHGSAGGTQVFLDSDGAGDTLTLECIGGRVMSDGLDLLACNVTQDIFIRGFAGNDAVHLESINATDFPVLTRVTIDGGTGTDIVNGTQTKDDITADEFDVINAGGGDDSIEGGAQISAGGGDDVMALSRGTADGGAGDDLFDQPASLGPYAGAAGVDTFAYDLSNIGALDLLFDIDDAGFTLSIPAFPPPFRFDWSSIDRAEFILPDGGTQTLNGTLFTGALEVDGGGGPDLLTGGPGEDFLTGGLGDDQLEGGAGFDYVDAGGGADQLRLRDGEVDRGLCGEGADSVVADTGDALAGCESVDQPPGDSEGPNAFLTEKPDKKIETAKKKAKVTFEFRADEKLSTFECSFDAAAFASCVSPFKAKAKSKPGKGKKHSFEVRATDPAGNTGPAESFAFKVKLVD